MSHLKGLRCKARLGSANRRSVGAVFASEMNAQVGSQEK